MYQNNDQPASVDGLAAALPCKTPVSLLQELCMRRGISPKYDLLQIEGAVHEPTFVYRVTVGEFTANGSGQSKKKAKHAAAKAVLDIIIHGGGPVSAGPAAATTQHAAGPNNSVDTPTGPVANNDAQHADLSTMVVSPYDDGIPGNPVGQLQELCMTRRWPPPTYQLTAEEGFPHERTFSIACTIATYKEVGGGKSKKLAKRQAAYSMLQKLRELPQEQQPSAGLNEDDDDVLARSGGQSDAADLVLEDGREDSLLEEASGGDVSGGRRADKKKTSSLFADDDEPQRSVPRYAEPPLFADQSYSLEIEPERDDLFRDYGGNVPGSDGVFQSYGSGIRSGDRGSYGSGVRGGDRGSYRSGVRGGDRGGDEQYEGSLIAEYGYQDSGIQLDDSGLQFDGGADDYGGQPKQAKKGGFMNSRELYGDDAVGNDLD